MLALSCDLTSGCYIEKRLVGGDGGCMEAGWGFVIIIQDGDA